MAKETVLIGCRLPNGLVLHHPTKREPDSKVGGDIRNENRKRRLDARRRLFSTTAVDAEFWAEWKAAYVGFPPLKNRAIFEARSDQEAESKAQERRKGKDGL